MDFKENDYRKYYDLESYVFPAVRDNFFREGFLSANDFFCIVIWKSNRAKSKIAKKLLSCGFQDLYEAVRELTGGLHRQATGKERLRYLMGEWKFYLPMATAILSVLYPDEFTVYDVRVCDALNNFHDLGNISINKFDNIWTGYQDFLAEVKYNTPEGFSLKDKDRWLWGKSFWEQLDRDVKNGFSINK